MYIQYVYVYINSVCVYLPLCSDLRPYFEDTYTKARNKFNQAIVTANLESDQEEDIFGRTIVAPVRYQDSDKIAFFFFFQENISRYCILTWQMIISPLDTKIDEPVVKWVKNFHKGQYLSTKDANNTFL